MTNGLRFRFWRFRDWLADLDETAACDRQLCLWTLVALPID
jgi:hypothetical protein